MTWTSEKLNEFKNYFALTDKQIAAAIMVTENMAWKMRNGVVSLERFDSRLTGYLRAVKAGRMKELEQMIEHVKAFE